MGDGSSTAACFLRFLHHRALVAGLGRERLDRGYW
jgi:hypothetical protein